MCEVLSTLGTAVNTHAHIHTHTLTCTHSELIQLYCIHASIQLVCTYVYAYILGFSLVVHWNTSCSPPSERALYSFECNFHSLFNYTQANCQVDYKHQENRWVGKLTPLSHELLNPG